MSVTPQPADAMENLLGLRIIAAAIDIVVLLLLAAVVSTVFGERSDDGGFTSGLNGWVFWLYIGLCFAYFILFESINGQSVGKKAMRLRVVSVQGLLTPRQALVRNLLRVIDGLPFLVPYLVGAAVAVSNRKHQRIGDMAAATLVVRARRNQEPLTGAGYGWTSSSFKDSGREDRTPGLAAPGFAELDNH